MNPIKEVPLKKSFGMPILEKLKQRSSVCLPNSINKLDEITLNKERKSEELNNNYNLKIIEGSNSNSNSPGKSKFNMIKVENANVVRVVSKRTTSNTLKTVSKQKNVSITNNNNVSTDNKENKINDKKELKRHKRKKSVYCCF